MHRIVSISLFFLLSVNAWAHNNGDSSDVQAAKWLKYVDSVKSALRFQQGSVDLPGAVAKLRIPANFKYLNAEQSKFVVEELWGNLPQEGLLGTLFPADTDPFTVGSYVFIISYEAMGYVKDDDVESIDYDEILKGMQEDQLASNKQRQAAGISTMELVGWASKPYYDKNNKTLHWAKNLKVEGSDENTLNYTVMLLGRHGILHMNAVSQMSELQSVKASIPQVLQIPAFTDGNAYKDFNPKADKIAAWTIGGLVAGKLLAKAGLLVLLLKFWKLIALGFIGIGAFIKKFVKRKKADDQPWPVDQAAVEPAKEETNA